MPKIHDKRNMLDFLNDAITKDGIYGLYASKVLNYAGVISDDNKTPYTEIIIKHLKDLEIIKHNKITGIETKTREAINPRSGEKLYYTPSHEKLLKDLEEHSKSNRLEEILIKKICRDGLYFDKIGKAIDFQIPLKSTLTNSEEIKMGKIDLLTYKEDTNELFIVEAKKQFNGKMQDGKKSTSEETLLRCCMEIQTYFQLVDKEKLIKDFVKAGKLEKTELKVRKAVLIFKGTNPSKEYADLKNRPNLKQLIEDFEIEVWDLDND